MIKDKITEYNDILKHTNHYIEKNIKIAGWIRNKRKQKNISFLEVSDGTSLNTFQVVLKKDFIDMNIIDKLTVSTSVVISGKVLINLNNKIEIEANTIEVITLSPNDYPIQPKKHSKEFLRSILHLRTRTNLFHSVFRIRSILANIIHQYFQENNYIYVNTPLITSIDAEGAGEMFNINNDKDFFGKTANLTVTGQLHVESFAMGFNKVYTFGPTFRAEKSNTKKHIAEFWMIEPEIAFADLEDIIEIITDLLNFVATNILKYCEKELAFLEKINPINLIERIQELKNKKIKKITYTQAIDILKKSNKNFENEIVWGIDLSTEHEKYLTETYFKGPVFITNYPTKIKAFYMLLNEDEDTVAAVDLLVPQIGELVGGSSREYRISKLNKKLELFSISKEELEWYIEINKYGGVPHSGFGIGFERLLMYITGIENIRDVIPFPRSVNNINY